MKTLLKARNTYRGIRNQETIERRNTQRSIKRNLARRNQRTETQSNSRDKVTGWPKGRRNHDNRHSITPECKNGQNIRINYNQNLNLLNLNTQGLKRIEKRTLIETYMAKWKIDLAVITETHINTNHIEIRKSFTWYFSGGDTKEHHFAGVYVIVSNKWKNATEDIQPISERIMYVTLKHIIPITIIGAYAPTAEATQESKDTFYKELDNLIKDKKNKHISHLLGDMNARIQVKQGPHEECIGNHTFNKANITLEKQNEDIEDNRLRFIKLCIGNEMMT